MTIAESLDEHAAERRLMYVEREAIDAHRIHGFVLGRSESLLLLHYVCDFRLDGLMVLRLSDVSRVASDRTMAFQTRALKDEGSYDRVDFERSHDLTDWPSALAGIGAPGEYVVVEDEGLDCPTTVIGRLESADDGGGFVVVHGFGGAGTWDEEPSRFAHEDISSVQLDSHYLRMYRKYLRTSPPTPGRGSSG